jgi:hypothetical protein
MIDRTAPVALAILIGSLAAASPARAEPLRYLGKEAGAPTGWIELGHGRYHEIGPGTKIPAWGIVKELSDERLVVELVRTEADKERARRQGALVHDVLELHIPRDDLRHPGADALAAPRR